jgi:hypothetical protein
MSFDALGDINWLAVLVGTVAYFLIGGVWFAPQVLGKPWMKAAGMEFSEGSEGPGPEFYLLPFLFTFVATIATAMLAEATGSNTFSEGLVLGLVIGIGFAAMIVGVTAAFDSKKPDAKVWGVLTAGYHVLGFIVSAVIVSVWN